MTMLALADVVHVLQQYRSRYRWLDLFAYQVRELVDPSGVQFTQAGKDLLRVGVGGEQLELRMYPNKGVVRCSLATDPRAASTGAIVGAAFGAMVGAGARTKGPEGMVLGLLLGGLVGATLDQRAREPDENRIMTLGYEPDTRKWRVYHGPYMAWAKEALRPG
jgi:hypothetical protein